MTTPIMRTHWLLVALAILAVSAGLVRLPAGSTETKGSGDSSSDLVSRSVGGWGLDLADRDASIKPGDDFYMSQNGAWFARTKLTGEVPAASYWADLRQLAPRRLGAILEDVAANPNVAPQSAEGKAAAFYRAFMDEKTVEAKGLTPLDPELHAIRMAKTPTQMAAVMGNAAGPGTQHGQKKLGWIANRALFQVGIGQDQQDPTQYAVYVGQGGLGLPGPEYYRDERLADVKQAYEAYAARMLSLVGWPNAEVRAREVVALETTIAKVSWSHEQMKDVVHTYHRMTVVELSRFAPGFDWQAFLKGGGLDNVTNIVIDAKDAFPKIAAIFAETPVEILQARQAFLTIDNAAPNLNASAADAHFDFRTRRFRNPSAVPRPRQFRAARTLEANIGDILSALYVARYFAPEAKTKAIQMAEHLKRAFDARLEKLAWMSPQTKARAREKLAAMSMNIGYPDKFQDYRGLEISATDLYGDVVRATAYNWRRQVAGLSGPFRRQDWFFAPQSVNYAYIPTTNTVEIPAATFQPPFFDLNADQAVNYGAVGSMIGAMIISGFDRHGAHYDAAGRLHDWLTPEELEKLQDMTKALAAQYSAVEPLPGLHVKGEIIADEAVQDLGGQLLALDAYHLSLNNQPPPVLDGFTGDQRVFLGRVQMWRAKFDPAFVRNQIATGSNAPPFLRVNGPVRNLDAWYDAFHVQPGDKLYLAPKDRVHMW